jgi:hypothetical protein
MIKKYLISTSLMFIMSGCVGSTTASKNDAPVIPGFKEPVATGSCLASQPKNVNMWINAMPGPGTGGRNPLRASFTVTTPTPGYQFSLKVNRVMESFPEQVVLDLIVKRPEGMVIQVVTESQVNIKLDAFPGSEGSSVQVNCGGKLFFKAEKVMAVH